jgi:hypothetical protein
VEPRKLQQLLPEIIRNRIKYLCIRHRKLRPNNAQCSPQHTVFGSIVLVVPVRLLYAFVIVTPCAVAKGGVAARVCCRYAPKPSASCSNAFRNCKPFVPKTTILHYLRLVTDGQYSATERLGATCTISLLALPLAATKTYATQEPHPLCRDTSIGKPDKHAVSHSRNTQQSRYHLVDAWRTKLRNLLLNQWWQILLCTSLSCLVNAVSKLSYACHPVGMGVSTVTVHLVAFP